MGSILGQIGFVAALVVVNAAFAGSEIALISLREGQLRRLEARSATGRVLAQLAREPNQFLSTIQIGITLAGFLASATAAITLAEPLVEPLAFLGGAAEPVAILSVTIILTFFTLVVGELAPKRVAMQRAEVWALIAARPLAALATIARPVVWLLGRATNLTVRLLGGDPTRRREDVTEEEIRDMVAAPRLYDPGQRRIITGALDVAQRTLRQVLTPRTVVLALPADTHVEEALSALLAAGHTRAPVFRDSLDRAQHVVSILDLLHKTGTAGEHARPAPGLPESLPVIDALRTLQRDRLQMALVFSEYGGFEGIVTVEDLVEEIVGEIHDEYDRDVREVVRRADGSMTVAGDFPVHDLEDLGVDLPHGDYVTLAGFLLDRLGRVPDPGDQVLSGAWAVVVDQIEGHRILRVILRPRRDT